MKQAASLAIGWVEQGLVPDAMVRAGILRLSRQRLEEIAAGDAEAMLAFSVWYGQQGYGTLTSCPAFDERTFVRALARGGLRGRG